MKKLLLLDANSIFHRAFHAVRPLFTNDGIQINAVFGFLSMLINILENQKPDFVVAAFDEKKQTFRHKEFPEYKANRAKAPDELYQQIPLIKESLESLEIPSISLAGFEADDILGTISSIDLGQEIEKIIFSSDNDILQLIKENTVVIKPGTKSSLEVFDSEKTKEKIGVYPEQIPDFKGLSGDSSDNIPGVPGVGPKTASDLIEDFKDMENIYKNTTSLKKSLSEKLENNRAKAFLSKKLATIMLDVPIAFDLQSSSFPPKSFDKIEKFLDSINSKGLKKRIEKLKTHQNKDEKVQQSLF